MNQFKCLFGNFCGFRGNRGDWVTFVTNFFQGENCLIFDQWAVVGVDVLEVVSREYRDYTGQLFRGMSIDLLITAWGNGLRSIFA